MVVKQQQFATDEQKIVLHSLAQSVAKQGCKFLEIGSWLGDSAAVLGKVVKQNDGHLFCVDWWKGSVGTELNKIASHTDTFSLFWDRICSEGLEDVIVPIRTSSDIAAEILKEDTFDLIFIDGDHRFDSVLKDIQSYAPLVARNGIFCGHDCEGRISDYDMRFLEAGKNVDYYEAVHCGVVLAVGSAFKDYSINWGIWSVKTGKDKESWSTTNLKCQGIPNRRQPPPPIIDSTEHYNLIRYGKLIYAFSHLLREDEAQNIYLLKQEEEPLNEYLKTNKCFIGKSIEEVKRFIKEEGISIPKSLESYQDYNLMWYKDRIYALLQGYELDLTQIKKGKLKEYQDEKKLFIANSIDETKKLINQKGISIPRFLGSYQDYDLVGYKGRIYALLQGYELDLTQIKKGKLKEYQDEKKLFIASSIDEAKILIK